MPTPSIFYTILNSDKKYIFLENHESTYLAYLIHANDSNDLFIRKINILILSFDSNAKEGQNHVKGIISVYKFYSTANYHYYFLCVCLKVSSFWFSKMLKLSFLWYFDGLKNGIYIFISVNMYIRSFTTNIPLHTAHLHTYSHSSLYHHAH